MAYKLGTITLDTTGLKTFNLGASSTPTAASIVVQNKNGVAETTLHVSIGTCSISGQRCTSYVKDGVGPFTFDSTTKVVSHYEISGGVSTEVLSASFDSFTSNGIKLNVSIANANYKVYIRVDY